MRSLFYIVTRECKYTDLKKTTFPHDDDDVSKDLITIKTTFTPQAKWQL